MTGASFIVFNAIHKPTDTAGTDTAGTDTAGTGHADADDTDVDGADPAGTAASDTDGTCTAGADTAVIARTGARCSIVEDGLMVQTGAETIGALRRALRERRNFVIRCGGMVGEAGGQSEEGRGQEGSGEEVVLQWTDDKMAVNVG